MELTDLVEALHVTDSNLTGSSFHDVDLTGTKITNARLQKLELQDIDFSESLILDANLSRVEIRDCNVNGMLINGVAVADLFAAYQAS